MSTQTNSSADERISATSITDEYMRQMLASSKPYSLMILREGPNWEQLGRDEIIWEHGRRNFQLRANGVLAVVCPVVDGGEIKGIGIFKATVEETRRIMDDDPGVQAKLFVYDVHSCRGLPGDALVN
jgi:hypothetical protein